MFYRQSYEPTLRYADAEDGDDSGQGNGGQSGGGQNQGDFSITNGDTPSAGPSANSANGTSSTDNPDFSITNSPQPGVQINQQEALQGTAMVAGGVAAIVEGSPISGSIAVAAGIQEVAHSITGPDISMEAGYTDGFSSFGADVEAASTDLGTDYGNGDTHNALVGMNDVLGALRSVPDTAPMIQQANNTFWSQASYVESLHAAMMSAPSTPQGSLTPIQQVAMSDYNPNYAANTGSYGGGG